MIHIRDEVRIRVIVYREETPGVGIRVGSARSRSGKPVLSGDAVSRDVDAWIELIGYPQVLRLASGIRR